MIKILPCITTITKGNWRQQLKDASRLKIREAAVFLTVLEPRDRQEFYIELKKSTISSVPHLHIRHDFTFAEIDFFYKNYHTRQFNTHGNFLADFKSHPYFKKYFLLETTTFFSLKALKQVEWHYCLDIAHYFSKRKMLTKWNITEIVDKKIKQGVFPLANHLSGLTVNAQDTHFIKSASYFDYLNITPKKFIAKTICLEVENSIPDQLKFIQYIKKLI